MSKFNEPWRVREYDLLNKKPLASIGDDGEMWVSAEWNILPSNSERSVCTVAARSDSADWSPTPNLHLAAAYRDRIIACVNACAGMDDPVVEIARLRAAAGEFPHGSPTTTAEHPTPPTIQRAV